MSTGIITKSPWGFKQAPAENHGFKSNQYSRTALKNKQRLDTLPVLLVWGGHWAVCGWVGGGNVPALYVSYQLLLYCRNAEGKSLFHILWKWMKHINK